MQALQTVLDYAAIAPILITAALFCEYCWRRSSPAAALVSAEPPVTPAAIPDPVDWLMEAIDPCNVLGWKEEGPDESAIADLLAIPATPQPTEVLDCTWVPLGKLYAVAGASKWGKSRRLRESEKRAVMQACCFADTARVAA